MNTRALSPLAHAALVSSLGMAEGSTVQEVEQRLLDDAARQQASADQANDQAPAPHADQAQVVEDSPVEERIVALAGDRIQELNAELATAKDLAAERATIIATQATEIESLKAEVLTLSQRAEANPTPTPQPHAAARLDGKSHFDLLDKR